MEDIERQLAAATLRAVRRESEERHSRLQTLAPTPRRHQTLRPRPLSSTNSGRRSVVVQRDVTALTPLTREVEPRSFAECAYEPPRRGANDEEQMAGAARWEMLGTDEVRACVLKLCADDMGALVCTHRAFAAPVEEAARYLLSKTRDAPAPRRCRISNAFCEPAWRAFKACARYHPVWKSKFYGAFASSSTPSTRRLLDGVAMPVPRRSTEPGRPRHRNSTRHTG
mgnify:CR=1 FL=1